MAEGQNTTGTTIAFGTSSFVAKLMSIDGPGPSRASIDISTCSNTNYRTFVAGALVDPGEVQISFSFDPTTVGAPPMTGASETITITWGGLGAGNIWAFSGWMTNHSVTGEMEGHITASATLKVNSVITVS